MNTYVLDTECYIDFWSMSFMDVKTREVEHFVLRPDSSDITPHIRKTLKRNRIVTFNGNNYDLPMISLALAGCNNRDLKRASDHIILDGKKPWHIADAFEVPQLRLPHHIDLFEVAPGMASLKIYAGRLHAPVIQDLPFDPAREIGDDVDTMLRYTEHDLEDTRLLFKRLLPQLKLRQQLSAHYKQDLMSKSDAQIAEAVIGSALEESLGHPIKRPQFKTGYNLKYKAPEFIKFVSDELRELVREIEADDFVVAHGSGKLQLPKALRSRVITIGDTKYKMGIGGLHSQEKCQAHEPADDEFLLDFDVASYYPSIILACGLYPQHLGPKFLKVYRAIVEERLAAKAAGDKVRADTLKITVNGSFGKFGSRYSILYSPDLLIQTTITGQLALLMLIESLELDGHVVSANTDGVVVRVKKRKYKSLKNWLTLWEGATGFDTEEAWYRAAYFRDVNNYLAIKQDGEVKSKGIFTKPSLAKNPTAPICASAVRHYLVDGTSIHDTVMACDDVRQFISIRKVKGGAVWQTDEHIGQSIRWYYSTSGQGALHYVLNGNKVPKTDGAHPLMTLPDSVPDDLDRKWYIMEAEDMLGQIGAGLV